MQPFLHGMNIENSIWQKGKECVTRGNIQETMYKIAKYTDIGENATKQTREMWHICK